MYPGRNKCTKARTPHTREPVNLTGRRQPPTASNQDGCRHNLVTITQQACFLPTLSTETYGDRRTHHLQQGDEVLQHSSSPTIGHLGDERGLDHMLATLLSPCVDADQTRRRKYVVSLTRLPCKPCGWPGGPVPVTSSVLYGSDVPVSDEGSENKLGSSAMSLSTGSDFVEASDTKAMGSGTKRRARRVPWAKHDKGDTSTGVSKQARDLSRMPIPSTPPLTSR